MVERLRVRRTPSARGSSASCGEGGAATGESRSGSLWALTPLAGANGEAPAPKDDADTTDWAECWEATGDSMLAAGFAAGEGVRRKGASTPPHLYMVGRRANQVKVSFDGSQSAQQESNVISACFEQAKRAQQPGFYAERHLGSEKPVEEPQVLLQRLEPLP